MGVPYHLVATSFYQRSSPGRRNRCRLWFVSHVRPNLRPRRLRRRWSCYLQQMVDACDAPSARFDRPAYDFAVLAWIALESN